MRLLLASLILLCVLSCSSSLQAQDGLCATIDRISAAAANDFLELRSQAKSETAWQTSTMLQGFSSCEVSRLTDGAVVYSCKVSRIANVDEAKNVLRARVKDILSCMGEEPRTSVGDMKEMGMYIFLISRDGKKGLNLSTMKDFRMDVDALKMIEEWSVTATFSGATKGKR